MDKAAELWRRIESMLPWLAKNRGRILGWVYICVAGRYLGFNPPRIFERVLGPNGTQIASAIAYVSSQFVYVGLAGSAIPLLLSSVYVLVQHGPSFVADVVFRITGFATSILNRKATGAANATDHATGATASRPELSGNVRALVATFSASSYLALLSFGIALLFDSHSVAPESGATMPLFGIAPYLTFFGAAMGLYAGNESVDRGSLVGLAWFGLVWIWITTVAFWNVLAGAIGILRYFSIVLTIGLVVRTYRIVKERPEPKSQSPMNHLQ